MELIEKLKQITRQTKKTFTLKGSPLSLEDMFSFSGILPGLARRADQLSSLCFGYGLGIQIEDDQDSLLGVKVSFDDYTPNVLRIFCIIDSLYEIIKMSPANEVPMDELLYD